MGRDCEAGGKREKIKKQKIQPPKYVEEKVKSILYSHPPLSNSFNRKRPLMIAFFKNPYLYLNICKYFLNIIQFVKHK